MSSASWSAPPPTYDARSQYTSLTPYLTLNHLLSLTWLAYPIISLIFIAFRLQLSLTDAQNAALNAKDELLTSCKAAEQAAASAASMPHFMALATNKQYADAVNASLNAARATLVLALTIMETVINFIVDLYRSTFLCFLELVVRGGLAILIGAVQEINTVLQSVTASLRTSIQNDVASANSVITNFINTINKANPFGNITPPQISIPSLDSLQNVTLPSSFQDALTNLNNSIPSVADIKDKIESVIDTPFELLKKDINDTFASISFEPDGLPVPEMDTISFCNQLDTSVIDDISHDFVTMAKIGVVILVILALVLIGLNCLLTWYKWRCMKNHLEYTRQAWNTDPTMAHAKTPVTLAPRMTLTDHNLMMLQANSEHPLITKIINMLSARFNFTPSQHTHVQWLLHYIFYAPALACFLIGFFGILSVEIQLLAIGPLVHKYQARAAATTADFSSTIATSINQSMYNQSSLYATAVNGRVDSIQSTINDGLFGWVNGTTTTLNNTINEFYTDVQSAVTTVFGGTILESPANDFLQCFLGSKIDAIENALTFLHDNLHIDIPRVNESVLVLSPEAVNQAAQPIAAAAVGGGSGDSEGLVGRLVNTYAESLRKERVMFAVFIALWGFVVAMGFSIVIWHSYVRPFLEARSRRKWEAEQRAGIEGIMPFSSDGNSGSSGFADEKNVAVKHMPFAPLPSPRGGGLRPFWSSRSPFSESAQLHTNNNASLDRPWDAALVAPVAPAPNKKGGAKLLALGRRALQRGEQLKKDGEDDVLQTPLAPAPAPTRQADVDARENRNTAWYSKMATLLAREDTRKDTSIDNDTDFWDATALEHSTATPNVSVKEKERTKPRLRIYTQRALDKYGPPPPQQRQDMYFNNAAVGAKTEPAVRSRFSVTPDAMKTSWISATKKPTLVSPSVPPIFVSSTDPHSPSYANFPYPPIGVPIRGPQDVPMDIGNSPSYPEDPFLSPPLASNAPSLPIPLHSSFENNQQPQYIQHSSPPRHPQLQAAFGSRRNQNSSPPPPLKSPRMLQPQNSLAPPPPPSCRPHKRSSSMGTSQWRVTNTAPGDSPASSVASLDARGKKDADPPADATSVTPMTRLLITHHARQSSLTVNPFITPFDDVHQVQIDHPTGMGARKSMTTNPFAHAIRAPL
ncbi:hypothetical protein BDN70DRAFT_993907 [Pholiota conissans]|uniref:Plasma membrane fusion protein PRM1 n=1 Tax=Pholiota conissans TaxID=109636 RepID=A0A9P5Z159_9AGAR|nr:hypothetical protein BDN70DRAFT_993907 [Pholiota conissans]